jgi:hypothetical protein
MRQKKFLKKWLSTNPQEMIQCPYQPGNLKILKKGCLQRLEASFKWDFQNLFQNEHFIYSVKQGLLVCKSCPVVETLQGVRTMAKLQRLKFKDHPQEC